MVTSTTYGSFELKWRVLFQAIKSAMNCEVALISAEQITNLSACVKITLKK